MTERHRYGGGPSRFAELRRPDGDGPHPVAVVLHGGFWKRRYTRRLMHAVCRDLNTRGWATWNLEYRRGRGAWPRTRDDVTAGVEHLATLPGLDLDRVVAVGHSAGGHLAAWLAATNAARGVRLRAACAQAGVVDLQAALGSPTCRPNVRRFGVDADPARLPLGVPVLCTHGAADDIVPVAISEAFAAAQPHAQLRVFAREGHMGHIDPRNPMWVAAAEWLWTA